MTMIMIIMKMKTKTKVKVLKFHRCQNNAIGNGNRTEWSPIQSVIISSDTQNCFHE